MPVDFFPLLDIAPGHVKRNLSVAQLYEEALRRNEGQLAACGALTVRTGAKTGRSPKDKWTVKEPTSENEIWWGEVNRPVTSEVFEKLFAAVKKYYHERELYVFDGHCGADTHYGFDVSFVTDLAWHSLFVRNMFIRPSADHLRLHAPEWLVFVAAKAVVDPQEMGLPSATGVVINYARRMVLIVGTEYAGEIKKSIFTIMNYVIPRKGVFPMHCSANVGKKGDCAVFFGLSGTGKTTLSADPNRRLIGDDEHGWSDEGVFNFEGGCYAKTINLSRVGEPAIWNAIRYGAVLENVVLDPATRLPNYADTSITENTRTCYPVDYIDRCVTEGVGPVPQNVFFLTCDAFGVLPPISRMTHAQAMYHFISGYTAKVAGTEVGVKEPEVTFSTCFGAPFMVLHPARYAHMLRERIDRSGATVWQVNTGWTGGSYGVGTRISLKYTRALLNAALNGTLQKAQFRPDAVFGLEVPDACEGVPREILHPIETWQNSEAYQVMVRKLAGKFQENFKKYADQAPADVCQAGPKAGTNP
ncbi:MAG TPA: phosphoenolpyruvate carboxykinase (ATP) [Planctomycetota bacterium]|nr:phosphoenolpyruvate carboxykinase (ATP) [Planctomycetota bacterium]